MPEHRFIVIGATGNVGRSTLHALHELQLGPALALSRSGAPPGWADDSVEWLSADVLESLPALEATDVVFNATSPAERYGPRILEACRAVGCHYLDGSVGQFWIDEVIRAAREDGGRYFAGYGMEIAPGEYLAREALKRLPDAETLDIVYRIEGRSVSGGTIRSYVEVLDTDAEYFTLQDGRRAPVNLGRRTWRVPGRGTAVEIPGGEAAALEGTFGGDLRVGLLLSAAEAALFPGAARLLRWSTRQTGWAAGTMRSAVSGLRGSRSFEGQRFHVFVTARRGTDVLDYALHAGDAYSFTGNCMVRAALRLLSGQVPSTAVTAGATVDRTLLEACGARIELEPSTQSG